MNLTSLVIVLTKIRAGFGNILGCAASATDLRPKQLMASEVIATVEIPNIIRYLRSLRAVAKLTVSQV